MDDYIKRKAVINDIGDLFTICSETYPDECGHHYIVEQQLQIHLDHVRNLPAADVAPVRYGRWTCGEPCPVCGKDRFFGLDADIWADWTPPYCPNCGARMDGDGE